MAQSYNCAQETVEIALGFNPWEIVTPFPSKIGTLGNGVTLEWGHG